MKRNKEEERDGTIGLICSFSIYLKVWSISGNSEQGPQAWEHFQSHLKLQKGGLTKTRSRSAWTWSKCYLLLGAPSVHPHSPDELEEQMVNSNNKVIQ